MLSVQPVRKLPTGRIQFHVSVLAYRDGGEPLPEIRIPVHGEVCEDVQVSPEGRIDFGAQSIGSNVEETITLRSLTGTPFEVLSIDSDTESLKIAAQENAPAGTRAYRLQLRVATEYQQSCCVTVVVRTKYGEARLLVPTTYYGLSLK